jgi:hypothetical protein
LQGQANTKYESFNEQKGIDFKNIRIYPMRYYAIFFYANNKQDYIMLSKPSENVLSHGVI